MRTPQDEADSELAPLACASCRERKRKCDKTLPSCSACIKHGRKCEYRERGSQDAGGASQHAPDWYPSPPEENRPVTQIINDFPTILFLDPGLLRHNQSEALNIGSDIPQYALHHLGGLSDVLQSAKIYFESIHQWMPIIWRRRFYEMDLQPSAHSQPDVVLLLMAIKLIVTLPPPGLGSPRSGLYFATKHFFLEAESGFSITILQAGLLIALYEVGHGIYPAAYLSVGSCSRYAYALGINACHAVPSRRILTLSEVEQRRRVWWALVILDRFVNIASPGRPLSTADPDLKSFLPADDDLWDRGVIRPTDLSDLSTPKVEHMSKFALLCQAARILGHVLHHVSGNTKDDRNALAQLDRTLQSMLNAALSLDYPDDDQISFIYSTLIVLYLPWLNPTNGIEGSDERFQRAKEILQQTTDRVTENIIKGECFADRDPKDMTPWGLFFAYHLCAAHMRSSRRTPQAEEAFKSLRRGFEATDKRWRAAGLYLHFLEAREAAQLGI